VKTITARLSLVHLRLLGLAAALVIAAPLQAHAVQVINGLKIPRTGHTATRLRDGNILIVGGENRSGPVRDSEIFDPISRTFSLGAGLLTARTEHTATRLLDGRVFIVGGRTSSALLHSTDIYDPETRLFSSGPVLDRARAGHTAALLPDGRIVVIGGDGDGSVEVFDPQIGAFSRIEARLAVPRRYHSAALLKDGTLLIVGGNASDGSMLSSAELLDTRTLTFSPYSPSMRVPRSGLTLRVLPDGKVQAIGGDGEGTMEMFNPEGRYFTAYAHFLGAPGSISTSLKTQSRAAVIGRSGPGKLLSILGDDAVSADSDLLDRTAYSLTELPGLDEALSAGGTRTSGTLHTSAALYASSAATVTTDKTDYSPGETIIITGTGWQPGETVSLNIHRDTNDPPDTLLTAVADASGNIQNSEYVVLQSDLGVSFLLTATGQSSGYTAQTTFTDGSIKAKAAPAGVTFTLIKTKYSTTDCTGTPTPGGFGVGNPNPATVTGVDNAIGDNTGGVGTTESLKLEAAATSDQGGTFVNWTTTDGTITVVAPRTICVAGFQSGNQNYFANYAGCPAIAITTQPSPSSQTVCPGSSVSYSVVATGTSLTYQWRKAGVNLSNGGSIAGATSSSLTINPASASDSGSYDVIVTDSCSASMTSSTVSLTVSDTTKPVPNAATLADVTGECSATITSAPTATDNCAGILTGTTSDPLSYATQGTHIITWTYDDGNGNTTTQTQQVTVKDTTKPVPNAATLADVTGECSAAITSAPTAADNCAGTLTGTTGDSLTYSTQGTHIVTWTYDDGNGNTTTQTQQVIVKDITPPVPNSLTLVTITGQCSATVTAPTANDNCKGNVTGTTSDALTYTAQGTYTVRWTYDDGNGNTASQNQTVIVKDTTPPVPNVATLPDLTGLCSVTATPPNATDNCAGTITATTSDPLTYTVPGTYTIHWTYNDGNGNATSQNQTVSVTNHDPAITSVVGPDPLALGASASVTANFTDPDGGQGHTCTFSWDDGTQDTTVTAGDTSCTASHAYASVGVYTVSVTVTDDCGALSQGTVLVVVYDPNAGFVTGGGWITSPAGAYVANPLLTGKANFGFVSKYQKGAKVPTGETEFQFQVANFNFHSTSYDWLVVSGPLAQYKGSGTVNGAGSYSFLLTARDGQASGGGGVDGFRIKIIDKATNLPVYDNLMSSSDDIIAANTQPIAAGSIVIHSK